MHLLGCLLAGFIFFIFIGFAIIGGVIDLLLQLLGLKKRSANTTTHYSYRSGDDGASYGSDGFHGGYDSTQSQGQQTQKIFKKDDSEYVDFEEV